MNDKTLGEKIKHYRKEYDISIETFSTEMGVSAKVIEMWEDDFGGPNGDQLIRMAGLFNVSFNELVGRVNRPEWHLKDVLIMGSLVIALFLLSQPLVLIANLRWTGFDLILQGSVFMFKDMRYILPVITTLIYLIVLIYTATVLFLAVQGHKAASFYTNKRITIALWILSILTIAKLFVYGMVGKPSIIFYIMGSLVLFANFIYIYRNDFKKSDHD